MTIRLQKLFQRPVLTASVLFGLGVGIPWVLLEYVSVLSDIGFADVIKRHRWLIIVTTFAIGLFICVLYVFFYLLWRINELKKEIDDLKAEKKDLNEQKDSVFRLMTKYKAEAQEDIFKRLRELAVSSILQGEWKKKNAHIERFRVERSLAESQDLYTNDLLDRVTVFINLNEKDGVLIGMRFIVQDPTDFKKYGTIVVTDCFENGSKCAVVDMDDPGFWVEISDALKSKANSPMIPASPNIIISSSPYKELSIENATQLLNWLTQLEGVDLQ